MKNINQNKTDNTICLTRKKKAKFMLFPSGIVFGVGNEIWMQQIFLSCKTKYFVIQIVGRVLEDFGSATKFC